VAVGDDVASLGIEVDSSQVEAGSEALRNYAAVARRTGESVQEVQARFEAASKAINQNYQATQQATQGAQQNAAAASGVAAGHGKVTASGLTQTQMWRALSHEISLINPHLAQLVRHFGLVSTSMSHLPIALTALAVGFAAATAVVIKAAEEFAKNETQLRQWGNAITLVGSPQSVQGLERLSRSLTETGAATKEQANAAITALLSVRNIAPTAFEPAIQAAQKLSQTGFVSITEASKAIGAALASPRNATEELAKAFIQLDTATQGQIDTLLKAGRFWDAQALVMKALGEQTKGLSDNTDTLAAKWAKLVNTFSTSKLGEALGEQFKKLIDDLTNLLNSVNALIGALERIPAAWEAIKNLARLPPGQAAGGRPLDILTGNAPFGTVGPAVRGLPNVGAVPSAGTTEFPQAQATGAPTMDVVEFAKFKKAIEERADALRTQAEAENMAAGAAAAHTEKQRLLLQAEREGVELSPEMKRQLVEQAGAVGALTDQVVRNRIEFQLRLQTMVATGKITDEEARIVQQLVPLYGDKIPEALASSYAAQIKFNNTLRTAADLTGNFIDTFVEGLAKGEGAAKSLQSAMQGLGSSITKAASQQLGKQLVGAIGGSALGESLGGGLASIFGAGASAFGGPIAGLAVGAGITAISGLFDNTKKQQEEAQAAQQLQQAIDKANAAAGRASDNFNRASLALLDTSTRAGALAAQDIQFQKERADEIRAGGEALNSLVAAQQQDRLALEKKFDDEETKQAVAAAQERQAALDSIIRQINVGTGQGFLNDFADLFKTVADAQARGFDPGLIAQLVQAQGQSIVNSAQITGAAFNSLLTTFPQLAGAVTQFGNTMEQVAARAATLDDRIFNALTDTSTLQGALASFDRQAQKDREEEIRLGGANIIKLEAAQQLERLNIYKQFNDRLVQQVQNLAASIKSYLSQISLGPQSTLDPIAKLAKAQTDYNSTLAQAQAGNFDAANTITQFASSLLDAAKNVYGSTGSYVTLFNQITTQLQALPAQVSAAQHIVDAINDNTDEVTAGNIIAQTQKLVLDVLQANTTANNQLVGTTNALQASANTILSTSQALLSSIENLNSQMNASLSIQSQTLSAIQNFTSGANDNLGIIRHNSTSTSTNTFWAGYYAGTDAGFPGAKAGMNVGEFRLGGWVGGPYSGRDSVRARLMPGEFVVRRDIAQANRGLLTSLNAGSGDVSALLSQVVAELRRNSMLVAAVGEEEHELLSNLVVAQSATAREAKFARAS
jgi:hypothetical protein